MGYRRCAMGSRVGLEHWTFAAAKGKFGVPAVHHHRGGFLEGEFLDCLVRVRCHEPGKDEGHCGACRPPKVIEKAVAHGAFVCARAARDCNLFGQSINVVGVNLLGGLAGISKGQCRCLSLSSTSSPH
jgi:hypothetical protein